MPSSPKLVKVNSLTESSGLSTHIVDTAVGFLASKSHISTHEHHTDGWFVGEVDSRRVGHFLSNVKEARKLFGAKASFELAYYLDTLRRLRPVFPVDGLGEPLTEALGITEGMLRDHLFGDSQKGIEPGFPLMDHLVRPSKSGPLFIMLEDKDLRALAAWAEGLKGRHPGYVPIQKVSSSLGLSDRTVKAILAKRAEADDDAAILAKGKGQKGHVEVRKDVADWYMGLRRLLGKGSIQSESGMGLVSFQKMFRNLRESGLISPHYLESIPYLDPSQADALRHHREMHGILCGLLGRNVSHDHVLQLHTRLDVDHADLHGALVRRAGSIPDGILNRSYPRGELVADARLPDLKAHLFPKVRIGLQAAHKDGEHHFSIRVELAMGATEEDAQLVSGIMSSHFRRNFNPVPPTIGYRGPASPSYVSISQTHFRDFGPEYNSFADDIASDLAHYFSVERAAPSKRPGRPSGSRFNTDFGKRRP